MQLHVGGTVVPVPGKYLSQYPVAIGTVPVYTLRIADCDFY